MRRIAIKNYDRVRRRFRLDILFGADFCDLFEVRGTSRPRHGRQTAHPHRPNGSEYHYAGLDGIERRTVLHFSPAPSRIESHRATFEVDIGPGKQASLFVSVSCEEAEATALGNFFLAYRDTRRARRASTAHIATVETSSGLFDEVMCRATSDVYTLITRTDLGPYPYAGIPWFNTIFGRDGIITAMFMLWVDPTIARGVLRTLASTQATEFDPKSDAQPGKILHERRLGEMANLGEVPFRRYYGSVDATPLFLLLAGTYFERTGDMETIAAIWPNIEAALAWIDVHGDQDGDGFVEYFREMGSGLVNQGWKDLYRSPSFMLMGLWRRARSRYARSKVYVYAAKRSIASIAARLGHREIASKLASDAGRLRDRFERAFWCSDIGTYALALDGAKRPCRVRSSNAGHALFSGIADPQRARRVAKTLMSRESFSGWGIRTIAQDEPRYNPMSYHNGSVWPHDNAMIAQGLAHYGLKVEAARVFEGLISAATHQESRRLPELFCGFMRRPHRGPTAYPVACSPQAWAAASPFSLLAACLGLELAYDRNQIRFREPVMPRLLNELVIRNLRLGASHVDVRLHRYGQDVTANVLSRKGSLKIALVK